MIRAIPLDLTSSELDYIQGVLLESMLPLLLPVPRPSPRSALTRSDAAFPAFVAAFHPRHKSLPLSSNKPCYMPLKNVSNVGNYFRIKIS
jgi:hypothetical protein